MSQLNNKIPWFARRDQNTWWWIFCSSLLCLILLQPFTPTFPLRCGTTASLRCSSTCCLAWLFFTKQTWRNWHWFHCQCRAVQQGSNSAAHNLITAKRLRLEALVMPIEAIWNQFPLTVDADSLPFSPDLVQFSAAFIQFNPDLSNLILNLSPFKQNLLQFSSVFITI